MSDEQPSDVLGALPRTRPHRRSDKRSVRETEPDGATGAELTGTPEAEAEPVKKAAPKRAAKPAAVPKETVPKRPTSARKPATPRLRQPAQPAGTPATPSPRRPVPARGTDIVGTAVQAAAELAEIGLSLTARAVKGAVSRLPRP